MMRTRGTRLACTYCTVPTNFQYEVVTPRGKHLKWIPCCPACGEQPARRREKAAA